MDEKYLYFTLGTALFQINRSDQSIKTTTYDQSSINQWELCMRSDSTLVIRERGLHGVSTILAYNINLELVDSVTIDDAVDVDHYNEWILFTVSVFNGLYEPITQKIVGYSLDPL
jgi:hypothetical protein